MSRGQEATHTTATASTAPARGASAAGSHGVPGDIQATRLLYAQLAGAVDDLPGHPEDAQETWDLFLDMDVALSALDDDRERRAEATALRGAVDALYAQAAPMLRDVGAPATVTGITS